MLSENGLKAEIGQMLEEYDNRLLERKQAQPKSPFVLVS